MTLLDVLWHTLQALTALVGLSAVACYILSTIFCLSRHPADHIIVPRANIHHSSYQNRFAIAQHTNPPLSLPVPGNPVTALITTFPVELLILVFEAVLDLGNPTQTSALLHCSHVCRQWRTIILDSCSLWHRALDIGHPTALFTQELLRSKPLVLDFCVNLLDLPPEQTSRIISNLAVATRQHLPRIRTYSLSAAGGEIMSLINSGSWLAANNMRSCSLRNILAPLYMDTSPSLPQVFMDLYAPHLQELSLWGCAFDWSSFRFTGLTRLFVHYTPPWAQPSQDQVISILRMTPHLQSLTLHDVLSPPEHGSLLTATLADLRSLDVLGNINIYYKLLLRLNLPSLQHVTCVLHCPDTNLSTGVPQFCVAISTLCAHFRPMTVMLHCVGDELEIRATEALAPQECLVVHLLWPSLLSGQDMLHMLATLCQILPVTQVRNLHLDLYAQPIPPGTPLWTEILKCFPAITNLHLLSDDPTPDAIMDELIINTFNAHTLLQAGHVVEVLLPQLKKLHIRWVSSTIFDQSRHLAELRSAISLHMESWPSC